MGKKIVILVLLALLVLGITQLAYATEAVVQEGSGRSCFLDYLSPEARVKAENIIREFHAVMTALRDRMAEVRGTGDREAWEEIRGEMRQAREAKREALVELLPEELKEQFMERGQGQGMRTHAPEDSQMRCGGGKGHGQQRMQSKQGSL